jgi:ABC-type uncharacterized transport system permease subunit
VKDVTTRNITLNELRLAGGCAGIAGAFQVTGVYHLLIPAISSNYGYLALLVVMLANYRIWGAPASAIKAERDPEGVGEFRMQPK